jgi:hypothetical protein
MPCKAYRPEDDFNAIHLSPQCADEGDGRLWCEDDQGPCDDCGQPSVKFIRADLVEKAIAGLRSALTTAQKALTPLAEAAESLDVNHLDSYDLWEAPAAMSITAGNLRQTVTALAEVNLALDAAPTKSLTPDAPC